MAGTDEDILRELLRRGTDDLHAPSRITSGIISGHRRRRLRNRALAVAATGAAAGTAFAVVASAPGGASTGVPGRASQLAGHATSSPAMALTAAQTTLYQLSSAAAAAAPRPAGRYVVLTEKQDNYERTSVIDSVTGDVWTYQSGAGVPSELPVDRAGSPTEAQFDAMPTDPAALRALLLSQAKQQQAQAAAEQQRILKLKNKGKAYPVAGQLKLTDDDLVFEQATDMLWNPLVGPSLRSALYKVLADTPDVVVDPHATDSIGRSAVEISRYSSAERVDDKTYENPAPGAVLETAFTYPGAEPEGTDIYTSLTSTSTLPANPYTAS
jgi:hypothetical protein